MQEVKTLLASAVVPRTIMLKSQAAKVVMRLLCQDPRDRVYGTLAMIQWYGDPIDPDYSKDRMDLAIEVLCKTNPELQHTLDLVSLWECAKQIALNLDLINSPSPKQAASSTLRQSTTSMGRASDSVKTAVKRLPNIAVSGPFVSFVGVRLSFQDDLWGFQHLQGHRPTPRVAMWPAANGKSLQCTKAGMILPPRAQSGDWVLIPISHRDNDGRYYHPRLLGTRVALLAGSDGSFKLELVGKVLTRTPNKWPWNWRNKLTMRAPFFLVWLDEEDVLSLMQSCGWDVAFDQQSLLQPSQRKQVEEYFRTQICRERFSSYAFEDDGCFPERQHLRSDRGLMSTLGSWRDARKLLRK